MTKGPPGAAEAEADYYQTIQEFFVSRRGDPLLLSNPDWLLIRKWRRAGVPLRVVLRGITDALDLHAHSWGRNRKIGSLSYCEREVEVAFERWQSALSEPAEGAEVVTFLNHLALRLQALPAALQTPSVRKLAAELCERATAGGAASEALECWLGSQETKLLRLLKKQLGPRLGQLEAEIEGELRPYAQRMPAPVLDQVRSESLARRVLETHGIPRLSLFHL